MTPSPKKLRQYWSCIKPGVFCQYFFLLQPSRQRIEIFPLMAFSKRYASGHLRKPLILTSSFPVSVNFFCQLRQNGKVASFHDIKVVFDNLQAKLYFIFENYFFDYKGASTLEGRLYQTDPSSIFRLSDGEALPFYF